MQVWASALVHTWTPGNECTLKEHLLYIPSPVDVERGTDGCFAVGSGDS